MRINRLEFQAVGPYAGKHLIDFDELDGSALYLIDGPTGAGKSTVIDCIVWALYGQVSGEASDDSRMRSHFAAGNVETYVELEFTTARGRFRIRRSPMYERLTKNGKGVTKEVASASLWKIGSVGPESLATGVRSTNERLYQKEKPADGILGLSREQFVQTVVLPQGEFATFLRAETKDRQPLLQRIFGTELYQRITNDLVERAKVAALEVSKLTKGAHDLLMQMQVAMGLDDVELGVLDGYLQKSLDDEFDNAISERRQRLADQKADAEAAHGQTTQRFESAKNLHDLRKREREATERLGSANETHAAAVARLGSSRTEVEKNADGLVSAGIELAEGATVIEVQDAIGKGNQLIGTLKHGKVLEDSISSWPARESKLRASHEAAEQARNEFESRISDIPSQIAEVEEHQKAAHALAIQLPVITEEIRQVVGEIQRFTDLASAELRRDEADAAYRAAMLEMDSADAAYSEVKSRYFGGQAATLASTLKANEPCPVCGSKEHPAPAVTEADAPTEDELARLETLVRDSTAKCAAAKSKVESASSEWQLLADSVTQDRSSLESRLSGLEANQTESESAAITENKLGSRIQTLRAALEGATAERTRLAAAVSAAEADLANARKAAEREHDEVVVLRAGSPSVADRLRLIEESQTRLQALLVAAQDEVAKRKALADAEQHFAGLEQHEAFGDVESAKSELDERDLELKSAFSLSESTRDVLNSFDSLNRQLSGKLSERKNVLDSSRELVDIAELFQGSKTGEAGRLSLQVFVLQTMFDSVLAAANNRLTTLLNGRYQLVATDDEGHASKQRGLGLEVLDSYTGERRKATTLSGGESFCASLALALGLSEQVQAQAGGIEIDTLFIDEGFGSLDGERLGDVMNMLQALQENGRTVGVISHVDEMKNQINEKINVIPGGKNQPTTLEVSWMQ